MSKLFVWDFHGVLEKGNENATREITNTILSRFGYDVQMSDAQTREFYGLKWYEYFEQLLPHESYERCLELQNACIVFGNTNDEIVGRHIHPNDHASDVLDTINDAGHDQLLISNTDTDSFKMFMSLVPSVSTRFAADRMFSLSGHTKNVMRRKEDVLQAFIETSQARYDDVIAIGDSPRDVSLASIADGTSYLYAHPYLAFRECEADYKIRDLREVLREI